MSDAFIAGGGPRLRRILTASSSDGDDGVLKLLMTDMAREHLPSRSLVVVLEHDSGEANNEGYLDWSRVTEVTW